VRRVALITGVLALALVALVIAFQQGQDRQCNWWRNHAPGTYGEERYCGAVHH